MAGNFWQSSHHQQWLLDKQDLIRERQHDLSVLTEEEYQKIFIFFSSIKNKFSYAYSQEFPYRTNHILECEFYLLEHLDCCLIVYQPYRPLLTLIQDVGPDDQLLMLAWRIINDSLRTDVCLLYPPYQIAIGCLQIACVILQKDLKSWFAELNADMEKIQEIARYIINLYELWKKYDEKNEMPAILAKMPKPKAAPQR